VIFAILAVYFFLDMRQAKNMAADVCDRAAIGMLTDDFLSIVSEKDYRKIKNPDCAEKRHGPLPLRNFPLWTKNHRLEKRFC